MPRMTLPSGQKIRLGVFHEITDKKIRYTLVRVTFMSSDDQAGETCEVNSRCSKKDNFCKATGRKIAAGRLMKDVKIAAMSDEDKQAIMKRICPEFKRFVSENA